jgi:mono/diheme cytochrome c family protein
MSARTADHEVDPGLYQDPPAPGEEVLVERLILLLEALIEKSHLTGTTYRDTHAKGHAAVRALFTVEPDLPPELAIGLFAQPRSYPAWVRLSNLNPVPQPDAKKDLRALSIKLMDVDGDMLWQGEPDDHTLDLILMSAPTFLAPNLQVFYDMEEAIFKGGLHNLWFFLTHPRVTFTVMTSQQSTASLLEIPYYSQTAYALGDRAVQYHLAPHQPATSRVPKNPTPNYLRERLAEDLRDGEAAFDFMVQLQTDPAKMPIEDPMVAWSPKLSPYRRVATLRLLAQTFDSPAQVQFCENISFTAWRTLPEHRPLGAINRARRRVYPAISRFRHHANDVESREPNPENPSFEDGGGSAEAGARRRHERAAAAAEGRGEGRKKRWSGCGCGCLLQALLVLLLLFAALVVVIKGNTTLPKPVKVYDVVYLNQGWTAAQRQWFYHTSQGSQVMPYSWFVNLEQEDSKKLFVDSEYMSQFRMIPDPNPIYNPNRLAVGFAKDLPDPITGVENLGITCAGCHTSQLSYHGIGVQIDGAPGNVNFNVLLQRMGFSLAATTVNPVKFNRFAHRVLGDAYNSTNKSALWKSVMQYALGQVRGQFYALQAQWHWHLDPTTPGFGRIDALGSGGNVMFGKLAPGATNLRVLNAPVKIFPLWSAYHYGWVQSNGSIRQPMSRNIIESLAVNAQLILPPQKAEGPVFTSSVRMENMWNMEDLAATIQPPQWPGWLFGRIDPEKAAAGKVLYGQFCARCHRATPEPYATQQKIGTVPPGYPPDRLWLKHQAEVPLLGIQIVDVNAIGTDPYDALNFSSRTADATSLGLHANEPGANIIYTVISGIMNHYYRQHLVPPDVQDCWNGLRTQFWRGPTGYPARPLAGIWAAPPYLHNGSVPNLYELLLPAAQRSRTFWRGSVEFDPVRVGYWTGKIEGGFELDTTKTGNSNAGHEFNDGGLSPGQIGRLLTDPERWQLIEYLKSMPLQEDLPPGMTQWPPTPDCGPFTIPESPPPESHWRTAASAGAAPPPAGGGAKTP